MINYVRNFCLREVKLPINVLKGNIDSKFDWKLKIFYSSFYNWPYYLYLQRDWSK